MKSRTQLKTTQSTVVAFFALNCFALCPTTHAVVPAPDGGYAGGNTAEGQNALLSLANGTFNTAVGFVSLTSITQGNLNTAVGAGSLLSNTADNNTATGAGALLSNTTGFFNTANGTFALASNIEGDNNTGIGSFALQNSTGDGNTAVGAFALQTNTTGFSNTAAGEGTLLFNTEGSFNTGIGINALVFNTTGISNTAAGSFALHDNTSGHDNTATGTNALLTNVSGDQNTADGVSALGQNTIGVRNTAIGAFALSNGSGDFNTALGFDAGLNVATASNVICIGANVAGFDVSDSCFIGNIYQKQVGADSLPVQVDSFGKLGTQVSSRRFKRDIKAMNHGSETLLALRPVTFCYNSDSTNTVQFGLIAEEVADVDPNLVVRDNERKPYSVRYDRVNAMLLNEFLKNTLKSNDNRPNYRNSLLKSQNKGIASSS